MFLNECVPYTVSKMQRCTEALLLGLLIVYCSVYIGSSQCEDLPSFSQLESLISTTFKIGEAAISPNITVLTVNYACLASGMFRGTYIGFSAVVNYDCGGRGCPSSDVSQFEFACDSNTRQWVNSVEGSSENLRTDVAHATLTSPTRTDCGACFSPTHIVATQLGSPFRSRYDGINHCLGCDPACNQGDMKCFDIRSDSCCNFYNSTNGKCLNSCPAGIQANENFECSGSLGLSMSEYVFSEESGSGEVSVVGPAGFRVRVVSVPTFDPEGVRPSGIAIDVTVTTPATIPFNIINDDVALEFDEKYNVTIIPEDNTVDVTIGSAEIIITDDTDSIDIGFESSEYIRMEGNRTGVRILVNGESIREFSLFFIQEGAPQQMLTLMAGDYAEQTLVSPSLTNPDDNIALQDDRKFRLALLPLQDGIDVGTRAFGEANLTVVDNDVVTVSFNQLMYTVTESESVMITLSLDHGISSDFYVDVMAELTPGAPLQHLEVSTPLTDVFRVNFISSPTLQSRSFTLSTVDDASEEPNEVAILSLAFVSDQRVMTGPDTQLVIVDDEEFDEIGFSAASYTFQEDEGIGRITIAGPIFPSSIFFVQISGGPGRQPGAVITSGEDVDTRLTLFPAEVTFTITDDNAALEPPERYTLRLTASDPSIPISRNQTEIVIIDDDFITVGFPYEEKSFPANDVGSATLKIFGQAQQIFTLNFIQEFGVTTPLNFMPQTYSNDYEMQLPLTVPNSNGEDVSFRIGLVSLSDGVMVGGVVSTGDSNSPDLELFPGANITITITPIVVGFLNEDYTVSEQDPAMSPVQVVRSDNFIAVFTLQLTAESDPSPFIQPSAILSNVPNTVTFLPGGDSTQPVSISLRDDDTALEDNEVITLQLSSPSSSRVSIGGTVDGIEYFATARVIIQSDDSVSLGIDGTTSRSLFEGDSTAVCVSKDTETARVVNFLLTPIPGSAGPEDFSPTTVATGQLVESSTGPVCFSFSATDDNVSDDGETFTVALSSGDSFPTGPGGLSIGNDRVDITIMDRIVTPPPTPGIDVEDTVIGDPLFTVPLPGGAGHLCYEIRGVADQFFNFISDECVSVNAHYSEHAPLPGEARRLHVIDQIAIRAVDNANDCIDILVDRNGCVASVNSETLATTYNTGGVTVSIVDNRVIVGVPNCGDLDLEMEIVCETINGVEMIRFEVMRGLNLRETSHGLLGQFWNVSISTQEFSGDLRNTPLTENLVLVTLVSPTSVRRFPAWQERKTWDNRKTCLFGGNQNGGTVYEVASDHDSLIQGVYTDYRTESDFSTQFKFSQFDSSRCS